mgnify:FL=1
MTEMDKLDAMLTERGIEHTYDRNFQDCGKQIIVYEHGERAWDAVCTRFSYGGKDGLLEVMAENLPTKVEGCLTAEQVMKMAYGEE